MAPSAGGRAVAFAAAHLAIDDALLQRAHAVDHQHAVEVIELVLHGDGEEAVGVDLEDLAIDAHRADADGRRAIDVLDHAGEREAALFPSDLTVALHDLRIDEDA